MFHFTTLYFPRFLYLTEDGGGGGYEMRNERTPHSYFVRIFLVRLAGSSAVSLFRQDAATQSPVHMRMIDELNV